MSQILEVIASLTEPTMWLVVMIIAIIAEALTAGLISIWFVGGALVALLLALAKVPIVVQAIAFIAVSFLLLILTRPLAEKWLKVNKVETNVVEALIGKRARVTETIDNGRSTGAVYIEGKTWTARNVDELAEPVQIGEFVTIKSIKGVKLLIEYNKTMEE